MATKWMQAKDLDTNRSFIYEMADYVVTDVQIDDSEEDVEGNVIEKIYVEARYFDGYVLERGTCEFLLDPEEQIEVYTRTILGL